MMNKKLYIFLCMMFLLVSAVSADNLSSDKNIMFYLNLDDDNFLDSTDNNIDWTESGNVGQNTGILNDGAYFDGGNPNELTYGSQITSNGDLTFSAWINPNSSSSERYIANIRDGNIKMIVALDTDDTLRVWIDGTWHDSAVGVTEGSWSHVAVTHNVSGETRVYLNNVEVDSFNDAFGSETDPNIIGGSSGSVKNFYGMIDELALWNETELSASQIEQLYNGSNALSYPLTIPGAETSFFSISNVEGGLNTYNATINGTFYSTTNGTIQTDINQSQGYLLDITIKADTYFDYVAEDYNTSNDLSGVNLIRYPRVNVKDSYDSSFITGDSVVLLVDADSYSGGTLESSGYEYVLANGSYTVNVSSNSYLNYSQSKTLTPDSTTDLFLDQSEITFNAFEKVTGDAILNFSVSDGTVSDSTTNGTAVLHLQAGNNQNISFTNDVGYFNTSRLINVSAQEQSSKSFTNVYNHLLTITANDSVSGDSINNFSITVSLPSEGYSEVLNTTTGSLEFPLLSGFTYDVAISSDTHTDTNVSRTLAGSPNSSSYNFELDPARTIDLSFFYSDTLASTAGDNVSLELSKPGQTYNFNTLNGSILERGLAVGTYDLLAEINNSDYDPITLSLTISTDNITRAELFFPEFSGDVSFLVVDTLGNRLSNVTVSFQRQINGSYVTVLQKVTDFSGQFEAGLVDTIRYKMIAEKDGYETFLGEIEPTKSSYTIIMVEEGTNPFVSFWNDISVYTYLDYNKSSSVAEPVMVISSRLGSLSFFGLNTTYDGVVYLDNITGSVAGGVATVSIPSIDLSVQRLLEVEYFFKIGGYSLESWVVPYRLGNITPHNISLIGGMFSEPAGESDSLLRVFVGLLVLISMVLLVAVLTRNATISAFSGGLALGVNAYFGLFPLSVTIVSIIALVVIIVADQSGGGF